MRFPASGFTLIELLVVLSIMALLSTVSLAKFAVLRENQFLTNAASEVQSFIRVAQTNATSNIQCTPTLGGTTWSLTFSPDKLDLTCPGGPTKTLMLSNNVRICSINYANCSTPVDNCSPTTDTFTAEANTVRTDFSALTGQIAFADKRCSDVSLLNSSHMTITVKKIGGSDTKVITVQKGGSIEINQ